MAANPANKKCYENNFFSLSQHVSDEIPQQPLGRFFESDSNASTHEEYYSTLRAERASSCDSRDFCHPFKFFPPFLMYEAGAVSEGN